MLAWQDWLASRYGYLLSGTAGIKRYSDGVMSDLFLKPLLAYTSIPSFDGADCNLLLAVPVCVYSLGGLAIPSYLKQDTGGVIVGRGAHHLLKRRKIKEDFHSIIMLS